MLWMEYPQIALPYSLGNGNRDSERVGRNHPLTSDHTEAGFPVQDPMQDLFLAHELMSK